jgi:outer membrane receptor protein involved in Fe transport
LYKTNDYHDTILRNFARDAIELTEKLTLYMGGEWSQNKYTGSAWSFRHTAMYNLFEDHFLRFTLGKAYHAHGFVEYCFKLPGVINGNPDLENERLLTYEVGYKGSLLNKKLYFDVELFINDIDKIRNTTTVLPATFRNDNKAEVYGVETALDYRPYKWLSAYFNYTALRVDDKLQIYDEQNPRHKVNLSFRLFWERKFPPDYFDAKWSYVGSLATIDPNTLPLVKTKVPNYFKLDIKLAKDIL